MMMTGIVSLILLIVIFFLNPFLIPPLFLVNTILYPILFLIIIPLNVVIYIFGSWKACKNTAEQVNFLSGAQAIVIFIECMGLIVFTVYKLLTDILMQSEFLNFTSSSNLKNFITTNPTQGFSVLVGIFSIIIVYLYFFTVLRKTKYFSENSEVQEKYGSIFWSLPLFILFGGFIILCFQGLINHSQNYFDVALFCVGLINMVSTVPIAYYLKKYFFNLNLSDPNCLEKGKIDYEFIENFQKLGESFLEGLVSDLILIMTFIWVGLSLIFNCNIFLLLTTEYCLLIALFWSSQLQLIPQKKITIELVETNQLENHTEIKDVYILSESSKGYFLILDKNNQISKIMKDSIYKLIEQNIK
jgi:hypothetical protein